MKIKKDYGKSGTLDNLLLEDYNYSSSNHHITNHYESRNSLMNESVDQSATFETNNKSIELIKSGMVLTMDIIISLIATGITTMIPSFTSLPYILLGYIFLFTIGYSNLKIKKILLAIVSIYTIISLFSKSIVLICIHLKVISEVSNNKWFISFGIFPTLNFISVFKTLIVDFICMIISILYLVLFRNKTGIIKFDSLNDEQTKKISKEIFDSIKFDESNVKNNKQNNIESLKKDIVNKVYDNYSFYFKICMILIIISLSINSNFFIILIMILVHSILYLSNTKFKIFLINIVFLSYTFFHLTSFFLNISLILEEISSSIYFLKYFNLVNENDYISYIVIALQTFVMSFSKIQLVCFNIECDDMLEIIKLLCETALNNKSNSSEINKDFSDEIDEKKKSKDDYGLDEIEEENSFDEDYSDLDSFKEVKEIKEHENKSINDFDVEFNNKEKNIFENEENEEIKNAYISNYNENEKVTTKIENNNNEGEILHFEIKNEIEKEKSKIDIDEKNDIKEKISIKRKSRLSKNLVSDVIFKLKNITMSSVDYFKKSSFYTAHEIILFINRISTMVLVLMNESYFLYPNIIYIFITFRFVKSKSFTNLTLIFSYFFVFVFYLNYMIGNIADLIKYNDKNKTNLIFFGFKKDETYIIRLIVILLINTILITDTEIIKNNDYYVEKDKNLEIKLIQDQKDKEKENVDENKHTRKSVIFDAFENMTFINFCIIQILIHIDKISVIILFFICFEYVNVLHLCKFY